MELVVAGGFEPPKRIASDLKSLPFDLTREYYLIGYPTLISLVKGWKGRNQIYDKKYIYVIIMKFFLYDMIFP